MRPATSCGTCLARLRQAGCSATVCETAPTWMSHAVVRDVRLLPHRHSKSQFVGLPISSTSATIVGAPIAGQNVDTTLTVAVIGDLKYDGI